MGPSADHETVCRKPGSSSAKAAAQRPRSGTAAGVFQHGIVFDADAAIPAAILSAEHLPSPAPSLAAIPVIPCWEHPPAEVRLNAGPVHRALPPVEISETTIGPPQRSGERSKVEQSLQAVPTFGKLEWREWTDRWREAVGHEHDTAGQPDTDDVARIGHSDWQGSVDPKKLPSAAGPPPDLFYQPPRDQSLPRIDRFRRTCRICPKRSWSIPSLLSSATSPSQMFDFAACLHPFGKLSAAGSGMVRG
jgi:hypothetical protein